MRTFLKVFCLFFLAFVLAYGQPISNNADLTTPGAHSAKATKLSNTESALAWAQINNITLPPDTPGITGGGLVVESALNEFCCGKKVRLVATKEGAYLLRKINYDGKPGENIGEVFLSSGDSFAGLVIDTEQNISSTPIKNGFMGVELIRMSSGKTERTWVQIDAVNYVEPAMFQFIGDAAKGDKYSVITSTLPPGSVVILGRSLIGAEILTGPSQGLTTTNFSSPVQNFNWTIDLKGPVTLTVCSGGRCESVVYQKRLGVSYPGKG